VAVRLAQLGLVTKDLNRQRYELNTGNAQKCSDRAVDEAKFMLP
jgi:hypothetical protein